MGQAEVMPSLDEPTSLEFTGVFENAVRATDGAPPTLQLLIDGEWRAAQAPKATSLPCIR